MTKHSTGLDDILGHILWYNKSKCLKFHHFELAEKEEVFCTIFVCERTHRIPSRYQTHKYKHGSFILQNRLSVLELCCKINQGFWLFFFFWLLCY